MKNRIRFKYMMILAGTVAAVILASWIAINIGLEPYYMQRKQETLEKAQKKIAESLESQSLENEDGTVTDEMKHYLWKVKENFNVDIIYWDSSQNLLYSTSGNNLVRGGNDLFAYVLGKNQSVKKIKETSQYQINKTYDSTLDAYYMEMFASYSNGGFSLLRVPLQSISETVLLINQFHIYVTVAVAAAGLIAAWFMMRNMTKPILELSSLAERMAGLDFTARYEGKDKGEIGLLGDSMNHMSEQLERTIQDLKTANLELKRDIEQKTKTDEMRREFLSNVSHELKTPIALIQGYAEGLKEGINDDPESMAWYCDVIMDESAKMNTMVKKLLTLNQIESGGEQISMEHFDLIEMIEGVLNSYRIMVEQKQAKVELKSPEQVYIWADEYMAEEVIRNYIGNALNHIEGEKRIWISVKKENSKAHLEVRNTGTPIPEEDLGRIWDKFYKVDKARTREYGGSGIGLSIVRAVMEAHNCTYGVRNETDGVTFFCEFDCK